MPDSRLSRLKAKLLRRSSTPAVPAIRAAVDPKSKSSTSFAAPLSPNEGSSRPQPYSTASSLAADRASREEISGPDTGSTADQGTLPDHPGPSAHQESVEPPGDPLDHSSATDRAQNQQDSFSTPELATSSLHTPITPASPSGTPPLRTPDQGASSLLPPSKSKSRARPTGPPISELQSTPTLNPVAENPSGGSNPPSFFPPSSSAAPSPSSTKRPSLAVRRQYLLPQSHQNLVSGLLDPGALSHDADRTSNPTPPTNPEMLQRKIWVKRPGGSATLVPALTDAVVDELRDQVILKYGNSLGKSFDSPDIAIRIYPRENKQATPERALSPEEPLVSVIDAYYPGGQKAEEALVIDIPQRRTPKPSPRHSLYYHPSEQAENGDYFTLMPANAGVSTPPAHHSTGSANTSSHQAPSISILTTGTAPPLPSPGSRTTRRRPPITRHTTNSPPTLGHAQGAKESSIPAGNQPSQPTPPIPTPPLPPPESPKNKVNTPPARAPSPRSARKSKKPNETPSQGATTFGGVVEGTVPPINVLIVEDNIINQKLLEAFLKRLSVRWKCAGNGKEALEKWRQGGFHLVLMDIQLPVMNGLDATKEIRRLERLNGIGVFPKTADGRTSAANATATSPRREPEFQLSLNEEDALGDLSLFKSPVIIVALTASSLQSDRHEALAAGCNDFLTKPIGFPWLEQKVTEWGCMQALIDFEGWRKWRGFADPAPSSVTIDSATSPMHVGDGGGAEKAEPSSPSEPRSTVTVKAESGSKEDVGPPGPTDELSRVNSTTSTLY